MTRLGNTSDTKSGTTLGRDRNQCARWRLYYNSYARDLYGCCAWHEILYRYKRLVSIQITAPVATQARLSTSAHTLVRLQHIGALELICEMRSLRSLVLRNFSSTPQLSTERVSIPLLWEVTREFGKRIAKSRWLKTLDLRASTVESIAAWPPNLEVLNLQDCAAIQVTIQPQPSYCCWRSFALVRRSFLVSRDLYGIWLRWIYRTAYAFTICQHFLVVRS